MLDLSKCKEEGFTMFEGEKYRMYSTKNYEIFKKLNGNRDISNSHVKKLVDSFKNKYLFTHINVNQNLEVKDGQHRLEALKILGLPIYFIVTNGANLDDIKTIQIAKQWVKRDTAHRYAVTGNYNYQLFLDFLDEFKFGESITTQILEDNRYGDSGIGVDSFNDGHFVVKNYEQSKKYARMFKDFDFYKQHNVRSFMVAMMRAFKHPSYNHNKMVGAVSSHIHKFPSVRVEVFLFLELIQKTYNFNINKKNRIYFITSNEYRTGEINGEEEVNENDD